ncbi:hypothetical protein LJC61_06605 [Ruminococcaceae bacterium OttesenSCG-928-A16]|nr:hypothetical protein [Ruminococcaceae bacterium OttesenSCG-928-A16]
MKSFVNNLYTGFTKTKMVLVALVAVIYGVLLTFGGASVLQLLLFAAVLMGYIVLPGLCLAHLLKTHRFAKGFTGPLALLLGAGFFAALYCVAMRLNALWLLRMLPPALGLGWAGLQLYKKRGQPRFGLPQKQKMQPHQWLLVLLFAALWLLYTFASVTKNAHPLAVGDVLLNQDFLWNVGNANSFTMAFPPHDIRFYNVRLHYHYLTELLAGALSVVSGISAYNIIGFYMQPFMLAALVLCLHQFGRIVWPQSLFKVVLFPYSLFLFSCASLWKVLPNGWSVFWNSSITHLITNINGQTTATVFLCIFGGLLVLAMRQKYKASLVHYALLLCAFFMLTFAKGPVAAMVICSLVLTLVIGVFQKNISWRGLVFGAVALAMFAVVYVVMFSSGANNSMPFSLAGTLEKGYFVNILALIQSKNQTVWQLSLPLFWLLQSFLMMPAVFLLFCKQVGHSLHHFGKLPAEKVFFNGVAVGGLLAFFWFNHPAMSQTYFLFASIFFVTLLVVDATDTLRWPKAGQFTKVKTMVKKAGIALVAFFALVGFATAGFLYTHIVGSGARQVARNLGLEEKYPYDSVMTPDDEAAMVWFSQNSPKDAMFATNRIHTGMRREGISNLYSALCARQGYMEGFQYAVTNMGVAEEVVLERLTVNNALFNATTPPQEVVRLCRENNISYLIFSEQSNKFDASEEQLSAMEQVYAGPDVRIYKLPNAAE